MAKFVSIALVLAICGLSFGLKKTELYPYGRQNQDSRLSAGDDISSEEIFLRSNVPISFFDDYFNSLYVNLNGHITFDTEIPNYQSNMIMPLDLRVIAVFLSDVDTSITGDVFYRETQDASLLYRAGETVRQNFGQSRDFRPSSLFIATWVDVGYYQRQYDKVNTYQAVIASDSTDSFIMMHYPDDGLQWLAGQGKFSPQFRDVPGQAGFSSGDNSGRAFLLPRSGQNDVGNLVRESNVNTPGVWIFKLGNAYGGDIGTPDIPSGPPGGGSCDRGGAQTCHAQARCTDHSSGFCCQCQGAFYGNGINCLANGQPQRVNGKVKGSVNGNIIDLQDLHSYIVTEDGRTFTAISRIGSQLGTSLQSLYMLTDILGWLFAVPVSPEAKNGYMITGGDYNRSATVTFAENNTQLNVRQYGVGKDARDYMRLATDLDGNIPQLPAGSLLTVQDYTIEYRRTAKGIIKGHSTRAFVVNDVTYRYTVSETITYRECEANPLSDLPNLRVNVGRSYVVYGEQEEIVRYATSNKIARIAGGDPCVNQGLQCDPRADCVPSGSFYRCQCQEGYAGDGRVCRDIDECTTGPFPCDVNADCINTEGGHECRCLPGFTGNGYACQRDDTCGDEQCDPNAECVFDSTRGTFCQCNTGFFGSGTQCFSEGPGMCGRVRCHPDARCVRSGKGEERVCECNTGFMGNGEQCQPVDNTDECLSNGDCHPNADCVFEPSHGVHQCRCQAGYVGDGQSCEVEDCSIARNCDRNAQCIYSRTTNRYECVCNSGFTGDGYYCEESLCDSSRCDANAYCAYDDRQQREVCACNEGYYGDGYRCEQEEQQCNTLFNCHANAQCLFDSRTGVHRCVCVEGYEGDGYQCTPTADCSRNPNLCDVNARCEKRLQNFVCVCNPGYRGDGIRCLSLEGDGDFLVVLQGQSMLKVPLDPSVQGRLILHVPGQLGVAVDVDCRDQFIYWTDLVGKSISRTRMDGSDTSVLVTSLGSPEGLSIDYAGRNMYYTDSERDTITVSDLDGMHQKRLHQTDLVNPRAIAVDPSQGLIFWTDWNRDAPKIERSNMDGSDRRVLVSEGLGLPNGLLADPSTQRICWADAGTQKVECMGYDGRGRQQVYNQAQYPFEITFAKNHYYWTDWEMQSLPMVDSLSGRPGVPLSLPPGGNGKMYGIVSAKARCPRAQNACSYNNGGCRFLCLPSGYNRRQCVCPDSASEEECNQLGLTI